MEPLQRSFTGVGGAKIAYQAWLPESEAVAVVVVVHGLGEHSGRYQHLLARLLPLGYAVYSFDLPGHGRSEGPRGFVTRFSDYTVVLRQMVDSVHEWHPKPPCFLIGHSMGGLIIARYLLDAPFHLDGAILAAPALGVCRRYFALQRAALRLLSCLAPRTPVLALDSDKLSRDPQVTADYRSDPLVIHGRFSARLASELLDAMAVVHARAGEIHQPLLLLQGDADKIINPSDTRQFYEQAGAPDKTLLWFEGYYHELLNEPQQTDVLDAVEAWLAARLEL